MSNDGSYVGRRICIQTQLKRGRYDDVRATVMQHQVVGSTRLSTRRDLVSLRYDDSGEVRDGVDLGSLCYLWIVEESPFLPPTQPDTEVRVMRPPWRRWQRGRRGGADGGGAGVLACILARHVLDCGRWRCVACRRPMHRPATPTGPETRPRPIPTVELLPSAGGSSNAAPM